MAILGLPGVKKDEIWVGRGLRDTRSPPEAFCGPRGGWYWGALRRRRPCAAELAGAARSGFSRGYGLTILAQKGPEEVWKLTELGNGGS